MRLFHHLWFFILWLNVDESLQQDEVNCSVPVIENGYVSGDIREYKRHEVLHFLCNETYSPFRKTPSICTKIGTKVVWDPTPKCERTTCRVSLLPPEGTRYEPPFRNLFSPGESVRVICGDKHNTSEVATCKDDGEWTFEPTCSAITCRLPHFPVGGATYDPPFRNVFPPGGRVKITCGDNYYISRPQDTSAVATCKDDGEWSFTPICREVTCPVPVIENGYVLGNIQEYKQHEYLEFECNPTCKRSEARDPTCTRLGTRAGWSPTPVCEPITCRLPHFPVGGATYDPPYRNVFPPGGRVKITCGDNYYISRPQDISAVATCKDDGEWSFELTCREVTCNRPRDPTVYDWRNWDQRVMLRDTVRYSCRGGYKRTDGATEATCTRDGWRPNPLCQAPTLEQ